MKEQETLLEFIKHNSFGVLVSKVDQLTATHLPFLVNVIDEEIYLYSHMAKGNPQWKNLKEEILVVFSGPQRYITPSWYTEPEVPTWNYLAAHLYGEFELISDEAEISELLSNTVDHYESEFAEPWSLARVGANYISKLTQHIVGFKIRVTNWEAAWKLHQDYSIETQKGVLNALRNYDDDNSKRIADLMAKNLLSLKER